MGLTARIFTGKYRAIFIAIVFFIVVDLGVLAFNFYTSFQIDQDAVALNISGRQRVTSQRIARTLLELKEDRIAGRTSDHVILDELRKSAEIFQTSQLAFRDGGAVVGGDGTVVNLKPTGSARGQELLAQGIAIWAPYYDLLKPLLQSDNFSDDDLESVLAYSRANNLKLLKTANDFVTETQNQAAAKASSLRLIQTVGFILAFLNFLYTVTQSIRQLVNSDRQVERAQRETTDILKTVKEGLFLLGADGRVGDQMSHSLDKMLNQHIAQGMDFIQVIRPMIPKKMLEAAGDYIQLLFANRVKESLVASVNPLSEVEVAFLDKYGVKQKRFLNFQFNRVSEDGKVKHLLVTVQDATERMTLLRQLDQAKLRAREDFDVMLRLLSSAPDTLNEFILATDARLTQINERLRGGASAAPNSESRQWLVNTMFRSVHTIKGDAAALGLELFEKLAHQFELELVRLREQGSVEGDDMITLMLYLDDFCERVSQVKGFIARMASTPITASERPNESIDLPSLRFLDAMQGLAQRIAGEQGKRVRVIGDCGLVDQVSEVTLSVIREIALQLLRNAVVHGIEPAVERQKLGKSVVGTIHVGCKPTREGPFELTIRDDGRGLDAGRIRDALVRSARFTPEQLAALSDQQTIMKIFDPGFSTHEQANRDAGHGVGLDLVRDRVH
jgi:two-component system chemotaxis sensor kinase CheA